MAVFDTDLPVAAQRPVCAELIDGRNCITGCDSKEYDAANRHVNGTDISLSVTVFSSSHSYKGNQG